MLSDDFRAKYLLRITLFQMEYRYLFPNEVQPSHALLEILFSVDSVKAYIGSMNIIAWKEKEDVVEIVAHWCLASKEINRKRNMVAFFEVLRLVKKLKKDTGKDVVIDGLNKSYYKATTSVTGSLTKRRFK